MPQLIDGRKTEDVDQQSKYITEADLTIGQRDKTEKWIATKNVY